MTSQRATDARGCSGCPDTTPPGFTKPVDAALDWVATGLPKGLPEGLSNKPLADTDEIVYSRVWGIYVGGSPEEHFATLAMTIPQDYTRATVHRDGSLEYTESDWEPPSPIDGYERDAENQWLFHPKWKSCRWRQYGVAVKLKCQCLDVIARCSLTGCWVQFTDCSECGARLPIKPSIVPKKKTLRSLRFPEKVRESG